MVPINPVRHKLKEARYFLREMEKSKESDQEFSFNLSAFLSAARSVGYVFQWRYQPSNVSTKKWLKGLGVATDSLFGVLFRVFQISRNASVHEGELPRTYEEVAHLIQVDNGVQTVRVSINGPELGEWAANLKLPFRIQGQPKPGELGAKAKSPFRKVRATAAVSDPSFGESDWAGQFEVNIAYSWVYGEAPEEPWYKDEVVGICSLWLDKLEEVVVEALEQFGD